MVDSEPTAIVWLIRALRSALRRLYDPIELGRSPLITLLGVAEEHNPPSSLRNALTAAIEALRPDAGVPLDSTAWRIYSVLSQRYTEQFTQRQVAHNLALSKRQVERLESRGLHLLAQSLQTRYDLAGKLPLSPDSLHAVADGDEQSGQGSGMPSRDEELEWLRATSPSESIDSGEALRAALGVIQPLVDSLHVAVEFALPPGLSPALAQATALRQALVNVLTVAVRSAGGGQVRIEAVEGAGQITLSFRTLVDRPVAAGLSSGRQEILEAARQLIALSRGTLEAKVAAGTGLSITLTLPAGRQIPVLVIDDNADALRMFQRYLAGSPYRFHGTPDPKQVLKLCDQVAPQIIILDVMLPGIDGWELLGRLREYPATRQVPVVICTILPQDELALDLGAAACLRKPVSRTALLEVLDRRLARSATGSLSATGCTPADPER